MVGWLKSILELNAKVFSLLEDMKALSSRVDGVDEQVREMGREISELQGMLKAYRFISDNGALNEHDFKLIQSKVDLLAARLEINMISHAEGSSADVLPMPSSEPDDDEVK